MTVNTSEFIELAAALSGQYELEREIGRGGMGVVYLARDVKLDRRVAIKTLPRHLDGQRHARPLPARGAHRGVAVASQHRADLPGR